MSGAADDRQRGTLRLIRWAFTAAALAAVGFAVTYSLDGDTQLLGATLALSFVGLAVGLSVWGRRLLPMGGYVERRPPLAAGPRRRDLLAGAVAGPESPVRRRGLVGLLLMAVGTVGVALLFPLRSLLPFRRPDPVSALRHTPWQAGRLLVTLDGEPVRLTDVSAETVLTVMPEGHPDAGDAPAFVVRLDPDRIDVPPAYAVGGVVAYSLLCTHAGCPVALYEENTGRMVCPCHQSVFDLRAGARPVAGPAARPLPHLPVTVDSLGYLRAAGDFSGPPGAGFWSRP